MAKYLIINADDFGVSHSENQAVIELLEEGAITSATVMTPCAWFPEAAQYAAEHPNQCIGVHLTMTSEWEKYRWGPVSRENTMHLGASGYFPKGNQEFESISNEEEVEREIRAQITLAESYVVKVSHLDNHMGTLYGRHNIKSYLPIVFKICAEMGCSFRFPRKFLPGYGSRGELLNKSEEELELILHQADTLQIPLADYFLIYPFEKLPGESYESFRDTVISLLERLPDGISEIGIHPSVDSEELRAYNPEWEKRVWEYRAFKDTLVRRKILESGIQLISWKELKRK